MRLKLPGFMSGKSGTPPARARHINAFPCPTWLSLCRAHVGHVGRARLHGASCGTDGRARDGCGPVGGMERRTPRRAAFPLEAGFCGLYALPAASMRGRCGGMRQAGASVLLVPAKRAELKKFPPTKPLFCVLLIKIASKLSTMCSFLLISYHFYGHGAKASHTIQPFTIAQ